MQFWLKSDCDYCSRKHTCELKAKYKEFQTSIKNASISGDEHFKVNIYCDQRHLDKVTFVRPKETEKHQCFNDSCKL